MAFSNKARKRAQKFRTAMCGTKPGGFRMARGIDEPLPKDEIEGPCTVCEVESGMLHAPGCSEEFCPVCRQEVGERLECRCGTFKVEGWKSIPTDFL